MTNNINISFSDLLKLGSSFKDGKITLNFSNFQLVADIKINHLESPAMTEFVEECEKDYTDKDEVAWEPLEDYDETYDEEPEPVKVSKASKKNTSYNILKDEGWGFSTVARHKRVHFITKNAEGHQVTLCKGVDKGLSFYDSNGINEFPVCEKCKKQLERKASGILKRRGRPSKKNLQPDFITLADIKSHTVMIDNPVPENENEIDNDIYTEAAKRAIIVYAKPIISQMRKLGGINKVHVDSTSVYFYTDTKIVKCLVVRADVTQDSKLDLKHVELIERKSPNAFINGFAIKINGIVEKVIEERKKNN